MRDSDIVRAFEELTLPAESFHHREHVLVAWTYLREFSFGEAGARFARNLRAFARANGAEGKYHETITWAYLALVNERLHSANGARAAGTSFSAFVAENPDLLDREGGPLSALYDRETLATPLARAAFVLPRPRVTPSGACPSRERGACPSRERGRAPVRTCTGASR
jgi:hypothetical protein